MPRKFKINRRQTAAEILLPAAVLAAPIAPLSEKPPMEPEQVLVGESIQNGIRIDRRTEDLRRGIDREGGESDIDPFWECQKMARDFLLEVSSRSSDKKLMRAYRKLIRAAGSLENLAECIAEAVACKEHPELKMRLLAEYGDNPAPSAATIKATGDKPVNPVTYFVGPGGTRVSLSQPNLPPTPVPGYSECYDDVLERMLLDYKVVGGKDFEEFHPQEQEQDLKKWLSA